MKLKQNLPLFILIVLSTFIRAEDLKSGINGTLVNEAKETIAFASVGLFSLPDSNYVAGVASDVLGAFEFQVPKGTYYIKISYLSYQSVTREIDLTTTPKANLGTITMKLATTNLNEITVEAERSQMDLQLDKRVFNVGKDLSNTGGNAANVLQNIPSVTLDVEGNVELRGSQNVRILINGKPSGLVGIDPATALEQIPANLIERVEVITNPSARYDAEGEVGIINIVLKKEERKGLNGSFELKGGLPKTYGITTVLNYKGKKVNYFGSYGYNNSENPGYGNSYQEFYNSDSLSAYSRTRKHVRGGSSQTFRLGADFMLNSKNTLTVSGVLKDGNGLNKADLVYTDLGPNGDTLLQTTRNEIEREPETNYELSLAHSKKFDKKGQEWSTEFKYIVNDETELSDIIESYNTTFNPLYQKTSNTEDESNWLFQSDYVQPVAKGKFETGVKSTNRVIENDFLVQQHFGDEDWKVLGDFDNQFKYTERIQAAYVMYSADAGVNWKYQAGVRAEYSDILTEQLKTNESNRRTYLNLFPSVHLTYKLPKGQSVQLSYSRRLSRPSFRHLLPFWGFSDNRNFMLGNPNLNPEFTHSVEFGYVKYADKGSFLGSVYYRNRTGVIERISTTDDKGILYRLPVNLSTQNAFGLELSGNYDPAKWWRITASMNAYRAITEGTYEGNVLNADFFTANGRISSNIKIKKKLVFQTSINFDAPRNNTQGKVLARWAWDTGLSYPVLKDKGTLSFSGRDMLNTRIYRWVTETPSFYNSNDFQWRTRTFMLTFSYRLNNYQEERRSRKKGFEVNDNVNVD